LLHKLQGKPNKEATSFYCHQSRNASAPAPNLMFTVQHNVDRFFRNVTNRVNFLLVIFTFTTTSFIHIIRKNIPNHYISRSQSYITVEFLVLKFCGSVTNSVVLFNA
jgi:hypothetical protein